MSATKNANAPERSPLDVHYMASRLRTDTWDDVKAGLDHLIKIKEGEAGPNREKYLDRIEKAMKVLQPIELYFAFPGRRVFSECLELLAQEEYEVLHRHVNRIVRLIVSDAYRRGDIHGFSLQEIHDRDANGDTASAKGQHRGHSDEGSHYFEVLCVDQLPDEEERNVEQHLLEMRGADDAFHYDIIFVPSFEDALIAVLFNPNIQSVVIRYNFPFRSSNKLAALENFTDLVQRYYNDDLEPEEYSLLLGRILKELRPELDLFLVTDAPVESVAGKTGNNFRRIFYRQEDYQELHLSIIKGINERFETPFFNALKRYSQKPTGVFHAMPLSRGNSIRRSHWIRDMETFYGSNIFMAETSSTSGGLDSLLQPLGPLKKAQQLAARAFGARQTFFVTNGTSTANKIVTQALVRPGDIVLVSRDCHKSHHYALMLAGAQPVYLDAYPLSQYSIYGAVSRASIRKALFELRDAGKLDRVRMLLLTNCTFDGITYNPQQVMEEVLAIKPDIVFLWDEAWFAYASFTAVTRQRTAMRAGKNLKERLRSPEYREEYDKWLSELDVESVSELPAEYEGPLLPDPEGAKVRVYATQSTHKTLTSFRQGSMIHVLDPLFEKNVHDPFHEAYMTHTSTSPNYQILASLDIGRRQVELEGYELVQKSMELAMILREQVRLNPLLRRYFQILAPQDMVPDKYRPSKLDYYYDPDTGWAKMEDAWRNDEFVLDATRVTLHCGATGMDGDTFKKYLIDHFDIQINKTSRNTLLFMIHIGTSRGTLAYLIEVLSRIAADLDERLEDMNDTEKRIHSKKIQSLVHQLPPLPNFSAFHPAFQDDGKIRTPEGDMRSAFFLTYNPDACDYISMGGEIEERIAKGEEFVSAAFVTPYPPGFPVLVPGQIISSAIIDYLKALDVKEIHGYQPDYGLRIFTQDALENVSLSSTTSTRELRVSDYAGQQD